MKTRVIRASVKASVVGYDLAVQGFNLSLAVNSIPSIELQCAPSKGDGSTPLKPNVKRPSISDFSDLYRILSGAAESLKEPGQVDITVIDDLGNKDEISLKGWILSGVGLSSVSASEAPYLSVVLQHPICKLTKVGSIYETPKSSVDDKINKATAGAGDFLEVVKAVYKCVREDIIKFWPPPEESKGYPTLFRKQLGAGEFDPNKYLVFKGENGIFLGGKGDPKGDKKTRFAQAIGRLVLPVGGGSSTWDMLVGATGPLLLSITQDESNNYTTDMLVIEPVQPWKKASINLYDEKCFWTELPGMDPFRITGVMCRKLGPYNCNASLGLIRNGNPNQKDPVADVMYIPNGVDVNSASGRIMKTSAPAVLDIAFRRDAAYGKAISLGKVYLQKAAADNYNSVVGKYCKALYEITAASMVNAKAQMAMWFRDKDKDGKLILPGNTCKFISKGDKGEENVIYYGYARSVVHSMSTQGGCSTTVSMSYVRPTENFMIGDEVAIAAGSKNAAYE